MPSYNTIIKNLIKKNISISIAESCTGGKLCKIFTEIAGISKILNVGLITYSNNSKSIFLKVSPKILKQYGAVSKEVANSMVNNLSKITKSKLCIATTGIAGPTGGNKKKPIGLVYIAIKYNKKKYLYKKIFSGNRKNIQNLAVKFCFNEVNKLI